VMADAREKIKTTEPELDIELTQVLQDIINDLSNAPEPIQIKIFSDDAKLLAQLGPRARRITARLGLVTQHLGWTTAVALVGAALVPLAIYAACNLAKFGTLFSLPFEHQAVNALVPERKAILAANHGTLVNVRALPTNLWQYLRPDAFRLDGAWPWVRLPTSRPTVFGGLRYDMLDFTSSVTATMPLLFVLAVGGIVTMVRTKARTAVATLGSLDLPVLGAACVPVRRTSTTSTKRSSSSAAGGASVSVNATRIWSQSAAARAVRLCIRTAPPWESGNGT